MRTLTLAAAVLLLVCSSATAGPEKQVEVTLDNGLHVTLRPLSTGEVTALVIAYDVGEDNDPVGKSGLSHLVEHCYVTSAAGKTPVRTAEEMMARYPQAWNAQTGARYTVFAFVFPKADLAKEVEEAAARMGDLKISQADLDREVPRMRLELGNMFDGASPLAASNRAWVRARPSPAGGRKGGVIEQIEALTLEDAQAWHRKYYKARNARLVLLGPFAPEAGKALIDRHFGPVPSGEVATPRPAGPAPAGPLADAGRRGGWVARAWPVPACDSEAYAPFMILARRLWARAMTRDARHQEPVPQFAPLDAPEVLTISSRIPPQESTADAVARIDAWLGDVCDDPLGVTEGMVTARDLGGLLGTMDLPDAQAAMNPYGIAFGIARRAQLGLDGEALGRALVAVDQEAFDAMQEQVFGKGKSATATVVDPHPAR